VSGHHVVETLEIENKIFEQVVDSMPSLENKCIAITGTTSGTGFWLAVAAARKKAAAILLLNRPSKRSEASEAEIKKDAGEGTMVKTVSCDLMSFESVRAAAAEVKTLAAKYGGLDVLACNAGIMGMSDVRTTDGFDVQMQVNHFSHFLLTSLLMPSLEEAAGARGDARVVQHSSGARYLYLGIDVFGGKNMDACEPGSLGGDGGACCMANMGAPQNFRYNHSKLANAVFAMALHDKLAAQSSKVKSLVVEPGAAATSLPAKGMQLGKDQAMSESVFKMMLPMFKTMMQSGADGTCPLIMACFAPDANSGDMYCPSGIVPPKIGLYAYGMPFKSIEAGVPFQEGREKAVVDAGNKKVLWSKSEAAIGEKFIIC